jgi:hypothetical protein
MTELPLTLCTIGPSTKLIDKFLSLLNAHDIQRDVRHMMTGTKADRHQVTPFTKLENGVLFYPAPEAVSLLF